MKRIVFFIFIFLYSSFTFAKENKNLTQAHLGDTAYLVSQKELLLSLRQVSFGVLPYLALETAPLYDMFGSWNFFTKIKLLHITPVTTSARLGIFYMTAEPFRYFWGGTASIHLLAPLFYHLNINNTSLHGNTLVQGNSKLFSKLTNVENDLEYRVNDRQSILIGGGYDFSSQKFKLGASHLWGWSTLYLKLGLTFNTNVQMGMTVLPFFDLGVRI